MQFTKEFKTAIRSGSLTHSFRSWKSPQAKVGGRYNLHPRGAIEVTALQRLRFSDARVRDIKRSGLADREVLRDYLKVNDRSVDLGPVVPLHSSTTNPEPERPSLPTCLVGRLHRSRPTSAG